MRGGALALLLLGLAGCGKGEDCASNINRNSAVVQCAQSAYRSGYDGPDNILKSYCNCTYDEAIARLSCDELAGNISQAEMDRLGREIACECIGFLGESC